MDLRAFSVTQPWASLLIAGVKRFEVRSWQPRRLGPILVHASSGKASGMPSLRADPLFQQALRDAEMTDESLWPKSAFVGLVEIAEVIPRDAKRPTDLTEMDEILCGTVHGYFLWRVGKRWPFIEPVPCHGKLNSWPPPASVHKRLNVALTAVNAPISR
jgi:hypothetical protein